jgi:hypothetical protein
LEAYAEGWQPGIVAEAGKEIGAAALEPLVALIEARPEIAERKAALGVVAALGADDVTDLLLARTEALAPDPAFCERASLYVTLAGAHPTAAKVLVKRIAELRPATLDKKKSTTEEKALARKCAKYVEG